MIEMKLNDTNLTPMQKGRLTKVLAKKARYSEGVMTLGEYLASKELTAKRVINGGGRYNRHAYNRMDGDEQRAYEKRLTAARYYEILFETYVMEIPKIVFDALDVTDVTDIDSLKQW